MKRVGLEEISGTGVHSLKRRQGDLPCTGRAHLFLGRDFHTQMRAGRWWCSAFPVEWSRAGSQTRRRAGRKASHKCSRLALTLRARSTRAAQSTRAIVLPDAPGRNLEVSLAIAKFILTRCCQ